MPKLLDELSIEEKVQITRAIIAFEATGESIEEIELFYDLDKSTISKIKKAINERLHEIFEPKQAIATETPKAKSILERISKVPAPSRGVGVKGSTESVNLSEEQRSKLNVAFEVIRAYNELPDEEREIKRKYTITADNLNAIAGFNRKIAGAWLEENPTDVNNINDQVEAYRKTQPQGKRGKDPTEPLKDFYIKQWKDLFEKPIQDETEDQEEVATAGESGSKK